MTRTRWLGFLALCTACSAPVTLAERRDAGDDDDAAGAPDAAVEPAPFAVPSPDASFALDAEPPPVDVDDAGADDAGPEDAGPEDAGVDASPDA